MMKTKKTLNNVPERDVQAIEVSKTNLDLVRDVPHGLIQLLIFQRSTLIQVLKATSAGTQFHKKVPRLFGASLRMVLQENSGSIVTHL
jgi:hypothetical protein